VRVFRLFCCAAVFLVASALAAFADAPRLALIITNKNYPASLGILENTHRDGERMAAALSALGFTVVHKRDLDKSAMLAEIADYVSRLERAGPEAIGFFYYSGHGAANSKYGENYLIPIAAPIMSDAQLPLLGVNLGEIVDSIAATSAKANFLVFDACRNVPISYAVKSPEKGLRPVQQRRGILVAFATDPGKTAGDEGIYAEALAEEIVKPGNLATEIFRSVRGRVLAATEHKQFPWIEDGLLENMYFMPPGGTLAPVTPGPTKPPSLENLDALSAEQLFNLGYKYDVGDGVKQDKAQAIKLYTKAGELGNAGAIYNLGLIYSNGEGVPKDKLKAASLYRRAADLGYPSAVYNLALMYSNGDGITQDKSEAARLYRRAADLGYPAAMCNLGLLYSSGEGVKQDKEEAVRLYRKAAGLGNVDATYNLALMYSNGEGVKKDKPEAARLYRKAAGLGYASAMYNLALMYLDGDGIPKDKLEALRLYHDAAELNYPAAMYNLALMYANGDGIPVDKDEAARLYRKAGDLGFPSAMYNLALMYSNGDGVKQDKLEAAALYRKAADLGYLDAMYNLALLYANGDGIAEDKEEAARLYRKAADQGYVEAIYNLGLMYSNGEGVEQDKVEAARLYQQAADKGYGSAFYNLGLMYENGEGVEQNRKKAAELVAAAIRKQNAHTLKQVPFAEWSDTFRRELQRILKQEGVYHGPIDGKASEALSRAVLALAERNKA
jgi:TPR repeat protein